MARKLTLIAGSGQIVPTLLPALRARGEDLQVIDLVGRDDLDVPGLEHIPLAEAERLMAALRRFRPSHLVMAGGVHISEAERRGLAAAFGPVGRLARSLGDLGLAGLIVLQARLMRIKLVGAHEVLPELIAPEGLIAGPEMDATGWAAARRAIDVARAIGATDLGQAVVLSGKRPVAAEDAAGTDALLERVAALRASGLIGDAKVPLVLAKALKPRQPTFADLPSIGPTTIGNAAASGIGIVAVEAGRSLLIERAQIIDAANAAGISVVGVRHG